MENCEMFSIAETASYLGVTHYTLQLWRGKQIGPPYYKLEKKIGYRKADLEDWIARKRVEHNTVHSIEEMVTA